MRAFAIPLLLAMLLAGGGALARERLAALDDIDCLTQEPDSVQINWTEPCDNGEWLFDTELGCRMWDWHPDQHDQATWSGECRRGLKEGAGVVQWREHGRPIDRFEGTFRQGRRDGFGRYRWNDSDHFEGNYVDDVPNGYGTVSLAGVTLSGEWTRGCLRSGEREVAIGVPRTSCGAMPPNTAKRDPAASF